MTTQTRHLTIQIDRPASAVYAYASNPAHVPEWAAGLGGSIEQVGGEWIADSPMGRVSVRFTRENDLGVLDHWVTLPGGETFYNPLRVIPHGDGAEVVFTLFRQPGVEDEEFEADARAIERDLASLKRIVETSVTD